MSSSHENSCRTYYKTLSAGNITHSKPFYNLLYRIYTMNSQFKHLSPGTRGQMTALVKRWKLVEAAPAVLVEGLQMLAADERKTAAEIIKANPPSAAIATTYGKGTKPKLALDKGDAQLLLEIVTSLNEIATEERPLAELLDLSMAVLVQQEQRPGLFSDESYAPLRRVITQFEPSAGQMALF
jgi:hypothetical protein